MTKTKKTGDTWYLAGAVVLMLILASLFYAANVSGDEAPAAVDTLTAPIDTVVVPTQDSLLIND